MTLLPGNAISWHIDNLISDDKQIGTRSLELTVREIRRFVGHGKVDFGGSEWQGAKVEPIPPLPQNADDEHGWWVLHRGLYQVVLNEKLTGPMPGVGIITPSERLTTTGAYHHAVVIDEDEIPPLLLVVGENGIEIKENARISKLIIFQPAEPGGIDK